MAKRTKPGHPIALDPAAPGKPTKADLIAAAALRVPDIIGPSLKVLFVGINPGLYSAAIGRHFGRPGNRFWPALHAGGFTPRTLKPWENQQLLTLGYGITNIVHRATARADELTPEELLAGARTLTQKLLHHRPAFAAILGVTAYRDAFASLKAALGEQPPIGSTRIWVLPNPSGLNAHYQAATLGTLFRELKELAG